MPVRKVSGEQYFQELARSSEKYFIPYISGVKRLAAGMRVLEFGCGQGGILLPFARMGCEVTGVDLNARKIETGRCCFAAEGLECNLIASDLFKFKDYEGYFDIIVCHDVIEHIGEKELFVKKISDYIKPGGLIFFGFPAWQMPFGGHQQNCSNRLMSRLPFSHLLPTTFYEWMMKKVGESPETISEMLEIKRCATSVELFERLIRQDDLVILDRTLYLINPHYEIKFGLRPRKLWSWFAAIPYLRDFFATSCFYLIGKTS